MTENMASVIEAFLVHRRALGRKYDSEEAELALLRRFADERGAHRLDQLTSALIEEFLASRPRTRPRSFNHLLGVVAGLLDWAVAQELLGVSPLRTHRQRTTSERPPFLFDAAQARRLLDAAAALPDNPRASQRGPTYRTIFALCYGLGLRAGEACGLHLGDVDVERDLLVVVGGKFGKSRLVPHGPRIATLVGEQVERRRVDGTPGADAPLFSFDGHRSVHPGTASQFFLSWWSASTWLSPMASRRRGCTVFATPSRSGACCAGIARAWTPRPGSISCRRSWATSTPPRRPSTSRSRLLCWRRRTVASRPSPCRPAPGLRHERGDALPRGRPAVVPG